MKSLNNLHFRSSQGRGSAFSKASASTDAQPRSPLIESGYTDNNDMVNNNVTANTERKPDWKKRRLGRFLLDQIVHRNIFIKLYFCCFWKEKKRLNFSQKLEKCGNEVLLGVSKNKTKILLSLRSLAVALFLCFVLNKALIGSTSSRKRGVGKEEFRLLPTKKPRILQLIDSTSNLEILATTNSTLPLYIIPKSEQQKNLSQQATDWFYFHEETRSQEELDRFISMEPFETEHCKAMYEWQKQSFPTCNLMHESQIRYSDVVARTIQKINYGFFRDIWRIQVLTADATQQYVVLKTLRTDKEYDEYNADRHRRDAVALERLTSSPHVVNIYGHCVNSQITEYSGEGDVYDAVFNPKRGSITGAAAALSKEDALRIAVQVATGVADIHNLDKEGQAPMAHTDIAPTQFILIDGYYKLNDFNRVRFIRWNNETKEPCPYQVMNNPGEVCPSN
jgi:hypothetical protein